MSNTANCKICGRWVDLDSCQQSPHANWLKVHQEPCMGVYFAVLGVRLDKENKYGGETGIAEAMDELLFDSENRMMHDFDLILPYFNWQMALLGKLLRDKETFELLKKRDEEGHENDRKSKESDSGVEIPASSEPTGSQSS